MNDEITVSETSSQLTKNK